MLFILGQLQKRKEMLLWLLAVIAHTLTSSMFLVFCYLKENQPRAAYFWEAKFMAFIIFIFLMQIICKVLVSSRMLKFS